MLNGRTLALTNRRVSLGPGICTPSFLASSRTSACFPFVILRTASVIENQAARSTSGTSTMQPDFGGHSREDVFVLNLMGSKSPSIAHAEINFPLGCLNVPNSKKFPATTMPVSSCSSHFAAESASSASSYSPFGIDHEPASFLPRTGGPDAREKSRARELSEIARHLRFVLP